MKETKQGALYCEEGYHFPLEQMWNDFVATLDMSDERFRLLVEEVNYMRGKIADYYEKEIATL
jgi:hypothetical protein